MILKLQFLNLMTSADFEENDALQEEKKKDVFWEMI